MMGIQQYCIYDTRQINYFSLQTFMQWKKGLEIIQIFYMELS